MQRGKCWDRWSMDAALIGAPGRAASESEKEESGVAKFLERWLRIGVSRSSSSRRGRARLVSFSALCQSLRLHH